MAADAAGPSVSVLEAVKRFDRFTAVDGVTFDISPGEIFGLLGPNGAGKSTVIRMLCGILKASSGQVTVLGTDAGRQPREVRKRIGYMSQQFSLYADLTVAENVKLYGSLYGLSRQALSARLDRILDEAGLSDDADRTTRTLSRGHRQRLALGCALLHEPELLFLDEPTSGVDPITRKGFWERIRDLADGGVTVLVTTHNMEEAWECGRLALMYSGRIIAMDTPSDLVRDEMPWTVLKVEASPLVKALEVLKDSPLSRDASLFGNSIHVFVDTGRSAEEPLRELLRSQGLAVAGIEAVEPSLEDVFVSLIEEEVHREGQRP